MSRGVLDQAAYDAAVRAASWAEAHGMKAFWEAVHYASDGTRTFRFRYEPIKKAHGASDSQIPAVAKSDNIRRGGLPVERQGSLI